MKYCFSAVMGLNVLGISGVSSAKWLPLHRYDRSPKLLGRYARSTTVLNLLSWWTRKRRAHVQVVPQSVPPFAPKAANRKYG
jgi:hypothetical protein